MNGQDIVTTSNADLELAPNGTGHVTVKGNTNSGAIQFNCESNSHGQIVKAQPHSAGVTNELLLPAGSNSTLVSLISTDTLTNKTLTAPKIADGGFIADANGNELIVFQTTGSAVNEIEITNNATGSNPIIAATGGDTNIGIALTPKGTGEIVIGAGNLNYAGTAITSTGAELNILDGVTSTAAELNALDGITAVVGELNALDLGSTAVGTAIASKAVILDSNKDYTGFRNITLSGELDAGSLDVSGDADIDGTANLDVVDIDGAVDMASTLAVAGVSSFAVAANVAQASITSSSNAVAWDASAKPNAYHVTTENTTFSAPSNAVEGAFICVEINYNGSHTIAWNTVFEFAASTAFTATSTDGKTDIIVFRYNGAVWQEVGRTLNLSES